ncbi:hypothetical protein [Nocardia sp. NBC_00403]|uniref:hypothetical protein n=1 Tax=Nocardia sp. NBC_00403 TaxID=2975990 RepID=UPI002E1B1E04
MIGPVARTDAAAARAGSRLFQALPTQVQLALLVLGLLVALVGCGVALVDQQSYQPSPSICRADEVHRTDCVHPVRVAPTAPTEWVAR